MQPTKEQIALSPECNEALKALGWKGWEPKVGDWGLTDYGEAVLVFPNWDERSKANCPVQAYTSAYGLTDCIGPDWHEVGQPLLQWENDIEPALKGLGYEDLEITKGWYQCEVHIKSGGNVIIARSGKTRQLAMMRAVIALAKEVGK